VLAEEDADAAHNTLTALHGIGPWTADVYLLFCLGHGDAWPAGDLAVQEAIKIGLGLQTRPTAKDMIPIAEPWRPVRGAAAHLWWAYYKVMKKREGVIAGSKGDAAKQAVPNDVSNKVRVAKPTSTKARLPAAKTSRARKPPKART
jgi:DNA-3-methyladenine glycosylase II